MTGRSLFRVLRWVGLAAVAPVLWACNARSLEQPVLKPEQTYGKTFQQSINRNVDHEQQVDVAVDRLLEGLAVGLLRLEDRLLQRARVARPQDGSHRGQPDPAEHAKQRTTGHGSLLDSGAQSAETDG